MGRGGAQKQFSASLIPDFFLGGGTFVALACPHPIFGSAPIYRNILSRTLSLQQIHIMTTALCRSCCTNCSSHKSSHTVATTCRRAAQRHSDLSVCLSQDHICRSARTMTPCSERPASGRMCHAVVRDTFPPSRRQVVTPPDPTRRSIAARQ